MSSSSQLAFSSLSCSFALALLNWRFGVCCMSRSLRELITLFFTVRRHSVSPLPYRLMRQTFIASCRRVRSVRGSKLSKEKRVGAEKKLRTFIRRVAHMYVALDMHFSHPVLSPHSTRSLSIFCWSAWISDPHTLRLTRDPVLLRAAFTAPVLICVCPSVCTACVLAYIPFATVYVCMSVDLVLSSNQNQAAHLRLCSQVNAPDQMT